MKHRHRAQTYSNWPAPSGVVRLFEHCRCGATRRIVKFKNPDRVDRGDWKVPDPETRTQENPTSEVQDGHHSGTECPAE